VTRRSRFRPTILMALFRRRPPAPPPAPPVIAPGGDMPVMPRQGRPGSITEDQVEALESERFLPPAPLARLAELSAEEAQAILDALAYVRAAVAQVTGETAPTAIENEGLALVLADEAFAAHAGGWSRSGRPVPLKEGGQFAKLRAMLMQYWQAGRG
jgi:hypothetical protein